MNHGALRKDLRETHRHAVKDALAGMLKLLDDVTSEPEETRWKKLMDVKVELARQLVEASKPTGTIVLRASVYYLTALELAAADEGAATAFAHADRGLAALLGPEPVPQHEIGQLKASLQELAKPKSRRATDSGEITETRPA